MRVFLIFFDTVELCIPISCAAEIQFAKKTPRKTAEADNETGDILFSLPAFFKKEQLPSYGIVLKHQNFSVETRDALRQYAGGDFSRVLLLTPPIEKEEDIPDGEIKPLPGFVVLPGKLPFFAGAVFTENKIRVIIKPESLVLSILQNKGEYE
jgi:hypothetical protein